MFDLPGLKDALERLESESRTARTAADGGDPRPLGRLLEKVPRSLSDPGARAELEAIAPKLASRFATYIGFPFEREARARAEMAELQLRHGKMLRSPAEVTLRLYAGSTSEQASALEALRGLDPGLQALASAAPPPPEARQAALAPVEEQGGILIPTPELMAELGLTAPRDEAPATPAPDRSRAAGELLRALAEAALGHPARRWLDILRAAGGAEVADFRLDLPGWLPERRRLPLRPAVPWARGSAAAKSGEAAVSLVASALGGEGTVGAALLVSGPVSRRLRDPGADRRRTVRTLAAAVGLAFSEALVRGASLEQRRSHLADGIGLYRPDLLEEIRFLELRLSGAPGEESALYPGTAAVASVIRRGVTLAADLRERFDEDWFENPRATREVVSDAAAVSGPATDDQVIVWLKELSRL